MKLSEFKAIIDEKFPVKSGVALLFSDIRDADLASNKKIHDLYRTWTATNKNTNHDSELTYDQLYQLAKLDLWEEQYRGHMQYDIVRSSAKIWSAFDINPLVPIIFDDLKNDDIFCEKYFKILMKLGDYELNKLHKYMQENTVHSGEEFEKLAVKAMTKFHEEESLDAKVDQSIQHLLAEIDTSRQHVPSLRKI